MDTIIEQLPSESLLGRCAEAWGLRNIQFVRKMENIVYVCDSDEGKVYLRLTTPLRRSCPEIEAEIHWIEHLAKSDLKVPRLISDKNGKNICSFTEGKQHFEAVVFSALAGEHPSKDIAADSKFLKTLGSLIAKMHVASQYYNADHRNKREEWFEERGLRHAISASLTTQESTLRKNLENEIAWMKQLPQTPITYGLIHADLGVLNLFIEEDDSIGIIDFDDCCYHWFVFDLAIVIFSLASRFGHISPCQEESRWLSKLIEGYRTVRSLSDQEIELIPRFIYFACLRCFFWIEYHEALKTFHHDAVDKVVQIKQWTFDRIISQADYL